MSRLKPWIVVALTAAFALSITSMASAQASPPTIVTGSVTSAGGAVAAGLAVTAYVGETDCTHSRSTTFRRSGVTRYLVTVHNSSTRDGCGNADSAIRIRVGDRWATQMGMHTGYHALNLTLAAQSSSVTVEVTVWRLIRDPERLYLSTRPEGGRWTTHNEVLDMSGVSSSGRFNQSNAIAVEVSLSGGRTATVEVTVWRSISDPTRLYLSTRPEGGRWTTHNEVLDMSGVSSSGNFNQSNAIAVEVSLR